EPPGMDHALEVAVASDELAEAVGDLLGKDDLVPRRELLDAISQGAERLAEARPERPLDLGDAAAGSLGDLDGGGRRNVEPPSQGRGGLGLVIAEELLPQSAALALPEAAKLDHRGSQLQGRRRVLIDAGK